MDARLKMEEAVRKLGKINGWDMRSVNVLGNFIHVTTISRITADEIMLALGAFCHSFKINRTIIEKADNKSVNMPDMYKAWHVSCQF